MRFQINFARHRKTRFDGFVFPGLAWFGAPTSPAPLCSTALRSRAMPRSPVPRSRATPSDFTQCHVLGLHPVPTVPTSRARPFSTAPPSPGIHLFREHHLLGDTPPFVDTTFSGNTRFESATFSNNAGSALDTRHVLRQCLFPGSSFTGDAFFNAVRFGPGKADLAS